MLFRSHTHSDRARTMIQDLIFSSKVKGGELCLNMSDEVYSAMTRLRSFLFENVYRSPEVHKEFIKAKKILTEIYTYFLNNDALLLEELKSMELPICNGQSKERTVCDFIASITDTYALDLYKNIFFPSPQV